MRPTALLLAAALVAVAPVPAGATGAPPGPGVPCRMDHNPFGAEGSFYSMLMTGGPVVIADGADPRSGRVVCTLRYYATTHADGLVDTEIASETSAGMVLLPPSQFYFWPYEVEPVVLCTRVEIDGEGTFYWDDANALWSTSPGVACDALESTPIPPDEVVSLLNEAFGAANALLVEHVDPVVCGALGGDDLYVLGGWVWDCPPYGAEPYPFVPPPGRGPACSLHDDPNGRDGGDMWGVYATAGPFPIAEVVDVKTGRVTCTVRWQGATHTTGEVVGAVTSPWSNGVAVLAPTATEVMWADGSDRVLCTQVEVAGRSPFYWDAARFRWSADPAVPCTALAY